MSKGKIVQIIGPVVDVEFSGQLPAIYNALVVNFTVQGQPVKLTLEVQQHLGDNWVRAVAMSTTEGLKRGYEAVDTGAPISMPVGEGVMGRVFNVTGEPVDEQGPVKADKYLPIHRAAPAAASVAGARTSTRLPSFKPYRPNTRPSTTPSRPAIRLRPNALRATISKMPKNA